MSRLVAAGAVIYAQADFFLPKTSVNRLSGVVPANLTLKTFVNGLESGLTLADGTAINDSSISSGTVYFNEISGQSGYYSVRFFADRVGFWRVILSNPGLQSEIILEFDIIASGALKPGGSGGLNASFTKT